MRWSALDSLSHPSCYSRVLDERNEVENVIVELASRNRGCLLGLACGEDPQLRPPFVVVSAGRIAGPFIHNCRSNWVVERRVHQGSRHRTVRGGAVRFGDFRGGARRSRRPSGCGISGARGNGPTSRTFSPAPSRRRPLSWRPPCSSINANAGGLANASSRRAICGCTPTCAWTSNTG